jgi:hypothetical protein
MVIQLNLHNLPKLLVGLVVISVELGMDCNICWLNEPLFFFF